MKNKKIVVIIIIVLFVITMSVSALYTKKIYKNLIKPIKIKEEEYNNLKQEENKLDILLKSEISSNKKMKKKIEENKKTKEIYEKEITDYRIKNNIKVIYLTFDDGPSIYTMDILNTLDKYNVKATFFVTCSDNLENISKEIIKRGHTIALHTCTHKYSYVYANENNYYEDLNKISNLVKQYTGIESKYVRFPGGSSNTISRAYNKGIMTRLSQDLTQKGYKYYDWNIDSNDAGGANSEQEYANVVGALQNSDRGTNMVLMHDVKISTRDSLDGIIKAALDMGYTFSSINDYTTEIHHGVNN